MKANGESVWSMAMGLPCLTMETFMWVNIVKVKCTGMVSMYGQAVAYTLESLNKGLKHGKGKIIT